MFLEVSSSIVSDLKSQLNKLSDFLSSVEVRDNEFCDSSVFDRERMRVDSVVFPQLYYSLRYLDIHIYISRLKGVYSVCIHGKFFPKCVKSFPVDYVQTVRYGSFRDLGDAISLFYDVVGEFFGSDDFKQLELF